MRPLILLLLLSLSLSAGCSSARKRIAANRADSERREAINSMSSAEAEARKQLQNW
jgi:hypothetical protein